MDEPRQMVWSKVRFTKQDRDEGIRMALSYLGDLGGSVAITRPDFAQVLARHAIQPINRLRVLPSIAQEGSEGLPLVAPVQVKPDALVQFLFIISSRSHSSRMC